MEDILVATKETNVVDPVVSVGVDYLDATLLGSFECSIQLFAQPGKSVGTAMPDVRFTPSS